MQIGKRHFIGIGIGLLVIIIDFIFLRQDKIFFFVLGLAAVIAALPFIFSVMFEVSTAKEKEEKFLEFSRDLVENVKTGTPISKAIVNIRNKNYGSLSVHVQKLANQVSLGIPVKQALDTFAKQVNNKVIARAIALIKEAEKAGGEIENILESVAESVSESEELKKERKSAMYNLVVQGYIIFLVFIIIMLVMEFKILPLTSGLTTTEISAGIAGIGVGAGKISTANLSTYFLALIIVQGLFAGLVIGKLSEGRIVAGIKHSFILMVLAFLITTGARAFLG